MLHSFISIKNPLVEILVCFINGIFLEEMHIHTSHEEKQKNFYLLKAKQIQNKPAQRTKQDWVEQSCAYRGLLKFHYSVLEYVEFLSRCVLLHGVERGSE